MKNIFLGFSPKIPVSTYNIVFDSFYMRIWIVYKVIYAENS